MIRRSTLLAVLVSALLIGSCGGSEESSGITVPSPTTTTSSPTTASTPMVTTTPDSTSTSIGMILVDLFFSVGEGSDCAATAAFPRLVRADVDPISAALAELVKGPTELEASDGASSFFSDATASAVGSVTLIDGVLIVDFIDIRPLIPNASTSCGSEVLLAQLDNTALQFDTVERVRYEIDGSCDVFANWLQRGCFESSRLGRTPIDLPSNEQASGSGCIAEAETLPDGRWFGIPETATADTISLDLACWFTGTAAALAATEDGEESPPPNDYYIRNASDRLRLLAVSADAQVGWLRNPGDPQSLEVVPYGVWQAQQQTRSYHPNVWLTVADRLVTSIEEQYVP